MTNRTHFLREQTLNGANKCNRAPLPKEWTTANAPFSLPERKAMGLAMMLEHMPLFIGEQELIVGTRTFYTPSTGNEDGHDRYNYSLRCGVPYVNEKDIELFGVNQNWCNKTHYTPDFSIILQKGIDGILHDTAEKQMQEGLTQDNKDFLSSVAICYNGLKSLILRYAEQARAMAEAAANATCAKELLDIAAVCTHISGAPATNFREAVQLLWFAHLVTIIESHEFINYGRLDVILQPYIKDTGKEEARQLLECLLLKMYDQADITTSYLRKYAAQLVVTLGGVLPNGENAVQEASLLFLDAIESVRLPEPEFNLRISSKNPAEFLDKAAQLTITGCNFVSYYNDDLFVESMINVGVKPEVARSYGFDLCQDITFPGQGDLFCTGFVGMAQELMQLLQEKDDYASFDTLYQAYKERVAKAIKSTVERFNARHTAMLQYRDGDKAAYFAKLKNGETTVDWGGRSPMCPLPYLSGLFHGAVETAMDMTLESYPVKDKGIMLGVVTECINSLSAIKKVVYDTKQYTLTQVLQGCKSDFAGTDGELLRQILWNAPKWGNDDAYVDDIAKDILEFGLSEILKYKTVSGGRHLAGIHQAHPIPTGARLMATPEGRHFGAPVSVTLTPESGTMKNGPTAVLNSASKIDYKLVQWNFCVMVNYFSSVFKGNDGVHVFKQLLLGYFQKGGLQHQPNVLDVTALKAAQQEPQKYKDLIVRLWGVSAHFVDLPKELQDEMIARFN